ncbi:eukaryotic translation initiation factor 3 subunit A-like isoform X1 [Hylaeus anthracinus]|uniref:eukaryotic translation initiation factor 3 subunit A-like isoform X1 n=1 Tax=Hylaeus anthracinus TaxID=313031 RepID=UPI0023B8D54E|nr:eukaryotic translation initiation factor 3 subunit A-like isoform X1 [Hylaeus anthracinus]
MASSQEDQPSTSKCAKKPRAFQSQAREIVFSVHSFLSEQKRRYSLEYNITRSVAEATGVSKATVERIVKAGRMSSANGETQPSFATPKKKHGGQNRVTGGNLRKQSRQRISQGCSDEKQEDGQWYLDDFRTDLKNLGPEEAAKCRPSNLSIDVWRLMEKAKKSDGDGDRSDENSQEGSESSVSLQAILDKLPTSTPDPLVDEIKAEPESDDSHTEEECSQGKPVRERKRPRVSENEPIDLAEQRPRADNANPRRLDNVGESRSSSTSKDKIDQISNQEEAIRRTTWTLEVAQKEHDLKLKILNIDLERAELEKQTAINELKTSEIKRQLIENEAAEYYGQARMSGERGSGAGKGGGGGGSIREAGGSFGKMEAAHEDQYFYNLQKEQFQKLKEDLHDEISFHEEQIKRHQEAINRHKQRITNMTE